MTRGKGSARIKVALKDGSREVVVIAAEGVWAYHSAILGVMPGTIDDEYFTVTHTPSGRAVRQSLSRDTAHALYERLVREYPGWHSEGLPPDARPVLSVANEVCGERGV